MKKLVYLIVTGFVVLIGMFIGGLSYAQEENSTTLLPGEKFRTQMQTLAGNLSNIQKIKRADTLTTELYTGIQASGESVPVYAWYDSGTIYYYTTAEKIYLNPSSVRMFGSFNELKEIDMTQFDTSKVTNMDRMFNDCSSLVELDLTKFDTSKVTNMKSMFRNCSGIISLDLSNFDTHLVTDMTTMFYGTRSLTTIFASGSFEVSQVTGHNDMFRSATSLVGGNGTTYSSSNTNKEYARIDGANGLSGYFTAKLDKTVLVSGTNFNIMLKQLATGGVISTKENLDAKIKHFKEGNLSQKPNTGFVDIAVNGSMYPVYAWYDEDDETIYYYTEADEIYLNTDSSWMFYQRNAVEDIDTSKFNTSEVENMQGMFNKTYNLQELDLRGFNTDKVISMQSMFNENKTLKELDLSSFNTSELKTMEGMFNTCEGSSCSNLETVYISSKFTTENLTTPTEGVFKGNNKLVGGNGTKFSGTYYDSTYARIDNELQSGYFTDPSSITVKFIKIDGTDQILQKKQTVSKGTIITGLTQDEIERKTGHSLKYYSDTGMTTEFDFSQPITKYTEIYTQWEINQYTITFVKGNGEPDEVITDDYGTGITAPTDPAREGYTFKGWDTEIPTTMPAENIVITAQWEAQKSGGGYSGGGGHSHDNSDHESTGDVEKENNTQEQEATPTDNQSSDIETQKQDSTKSVHEWSYKNGLTQYANEKDARLGDYLTRSQMAKISSIFATKVLGKLPDESKYNFCSQFADISTLNTEMKSYVIESCELGYMGYQSNGTDSLVKFRPYSPITVAEVAVIVSRMLRGNQNAGDGNKWYQGHLYAAYNHELIDDIRNPFRNITRGEAFEIFYRTSQSK